MRVAVAVITDTEQRILITRRSLQAPHGGLWEFPGGKLETDELASEALHRELKEEVGIDVKAYDYLGEISHSYQDKKISLLVYHVHSYQGEAACYEAQIGIRWVALGDLNFFQFPPANVEIIEMIRQRFATTDK